MVSAYIASAVKAKVALIEKHKMGGDCLNTGCVPSKALLRSAKMLSYAKRAKEFGFKKNTVEFIIIPAVAFTITLIIWIITLGNVDFWELYDTIHALLLTMSEGIIEVIQEFTEHIVDVVLFIGLYLLLILMCLLKYIVVRARGFVNRALALRESYETYIYPIEIYRPL